MRIRDLLDFGRPYETNPTTRTERLMQQKDIIEHYDEADETDPKKIKADVARIMARKPQGLEIDELPLMYGNEAEELELARQRLELRRLEAEVEETLASAARDRAEAIRQLRSPGS